MPEPRKPDAAVEAAIDRLTPRRHNGKPKVRLVWGPDRLHFIAGVFTDRDASGNFLRCVYDQRWVPKYQKVNFWYLEIWEPPEFFGSPDTWHSRLLTHEGGRFFVELGPYPQDGDFRPLAILEHQVTGERVEPTVQLIERIFSQMVIPTRGDLVKEENAVQEAEDRELHKTVDDMFGDPFPFGGSTNSVTPKPLITQLKEEEKRGKADDGYN